MKLKRFLGILFSVALMLAAMSVTAYAVSGTAYSSFIPTSTDDANNLAAKQVIFNGIKWYIINDNSSSATEGTLTLFAADTKFGVSVFDNTDPKNNDYSQSDVKNYLDNVVNGTAGDGKPNFNDVKSAINTVEGGKLYLLSKEDLNSVPINVRKITGFSSTNNAWWLRTPGTGGTGSNREMHVGGDGGTISESGYNITSLLGVRPALQLDLSKVVFDSTTQTFSLKVDVDDVSLAPDTATLTVGNSVALTATISPGEATDKKVIWSVGGSNPEAVKLYSNSACTTEVGTGAVADLTVYVKGVSAGNADVIVKSNSDGNKSASCSVKVNPVTYSVKLTGGANAATSGGNTNQVGLTGAMTTVTYSANTGYYFAEFTDITNNGITAKWTSSIDVTVSGTPSADAVITVPDAQPISTDAVPYKVVTYKVVNGTWSDGSTTDRKETVADGSKPASVPTDMKASEGYTGGAWDTNPADATITGATMFTYTFTAIPTHTVTYKVVNGTWSDGSTEDKTETVESGSKPNDVPTGMKTSEGYTGGEWDTDPAEATITGETTFTYTFTAKEEEAEKESPNPTPTPPAPSYTPTPEPAQTPEPTPAPETPAVNQYTHDAFTGVTETIEPSTNGIAAVTNVESTNPSTLRLTGMVNHNGKDYPVSAFATNSFQNVVASRIVIDLKKSGNTEKVVFMPQTFKGSGAETLCLKLSSASQVGFMKGALDGSKIKKIVVYGLTKSEFNRVKQKLRAAGYKWKVVWKKAK